MEIPLCLDLASHIMDTQSSRGELLDADLGMGELFILLLGSNYFMKYCRM
jgi:hypothetical protein